jgi:hypothetical protein
VTPDISLPALTIFTTKVEKEQDIPFADNCDEGLPQIRFFSLGLAFSLGPTLAALHSLEDESKTPTFTFPTCSVMAFIGPISFATFFFCLHWPDIFSDIFLPPSLARHLQRHFSSAFIGPISSALPISAGSTVSH